MRKTRMSFENDFRKIDTLLNNKSCIVDFIKLQSIEQSTHRRNLISPFDVQQTIKDMEWIDLKQRKKNPYAWIGRKNPVVESSLSHELNWQCCVIQWMWNISEIKSKPNVMFIVAVMFSLHWPRKSAFTLWLRHCGSVVVVVGAFVLYILFTTCILSRISFYEKGKTVIHSR